MTTPDPRVLPSRTVPADWTPGHLAARDRLQAEGKDISDAHPEWLEVRTVLEDPDGLPVGLAVHRLPMVGPRSGCTCGMEHNPRPPLDEHGYRLQYAGDDDNDPGPGEPVPVS